MSMRPHATPLCATPGTHPVHWEHTPGPPPLATPVHNRRCTPVRRPYGRRNTSPMVCATFAPIPFTIKDIPVTIDVGTNHAQADVGNVPKELMGDTPQPNA